MTLCSALYYGSSHSHDVICHWTPLISERSARFNWSVLGGGRRCCCDCGGIFFGAHASFFFFLFCDDADIKRENRTRRDLILRNNRRHCQPAPSYTSRIITARRRMSLTSAAVFCSPSSVPLQQQIYNFREGLKQNMTVVVLSLQLLLYFYMYCKE